MPSQADIVNMALDQISSTVTIQSIDPPMPIGVTSEVAARNWLVRLDAVSRGAHWNCLRYQEELTLLKSATGTPENPSGALPRPPIPWLYEYAYPTDCLLMRFLIPQVVQVGSSVPFMTNTGGLVMQNAITQIPFVPASDKDANGNNIRVILTNAPVAVGVYTKRLQDPNLWDPDFQEAVIAVLAAWFVNPLSKNEQTLKDCIALAQQAIAKGRMSNGNEGITNIDHYPDFMQVRGGGGYSDYQNGGLPMVNAGYAGVALPGLMY